jgi:hypothetical protein
MNEFLISALPLVMMGVVLWYLLRTRRPHKSKPPKLDHQTRQERAVWAWARVLTSTCGPADISGAARVEMELEVHTPGSQPYRAKTTWQVDQEALAFVEEGKEISLKVDPESPEFIYPKGPWAKFVE